MNSVRRTALWHNIVTALLLVFALGMIGLAVAGESGARFSHLPQLVHDALKKSFSGAI